jgi:hypothetical protein
MIKEAGLKKSEVVVYAGFDVFNRRLTNAGTYDEPIVQTWFNQKLNVVKAGRDPLNRADSMRKHLEDWGSDEEWPEGRPGLQAMDCCRNFIRTMPLLKSDLNNAEVPDTTLEDHAYDAVGHVLTSLSAGPEEETEEEEVEDPARGRAVQDEAEEDEETREPYVME